MELSIDPDCLIVRREEKEKKRIEYTHLLRLHRVTQEKEKKVNRIEEEGEMRYRVVEVIK